MRFDIHLHTDLSACSSLTIEAIMKAAASRGLDGICITDHNSMAIKYIVKEGKQDNGLLVIIGTEYDTDNGDFLLFGQDEEITPGLSAVEILTMAGERGWAAVAAHPFRNDRPVSELLIAQGLCKIVERVNGRNSPAVNDMTELWIQRYGLTQCGGSDAHSPEEVGNAFTIFTDPIRSKHDLVMALKAGRCTGAAGAPEGSIFG